MYVTKPREYKADHYVTATNHLPVGPGHHDDCKCHGAKQAPGHQQPPCITRLNILQQPYYATYILRYSHHTNYVGMSSSVSNPLVSILLMGCSYYYFFCLIRYQSMYAPSQWETSLQCNDVSHWLGAYLNWSLAHVVPVLTDHRANNESCSRDQPQLLLELQPPSTIFCLLRRDGVTWRDGGRTSVSASIFMTVPADVTSCKEIIDAVLVRTHGQLKSMVSTLQWRHSIVPCHWFYYHK